MPSAPGYKRDYQQERKTAIARGEMTGHAERLRARRKAVKLGMVRPHDKKDLDHAQPLSKGGSNAPSNFRVESEHANRSFPRGRGGQLLKNVEETKPGHDRK
jgi:hypothetical protein